MRSSGDEVYISGVSCRCLARSSNSVGSAGADGTGRPQLGLPRLRLRAAGIAIGPDHTPHSVALQESAHPVFHAASARDNYRKNSHCFWRPGSTLSSATCAGTPRSNSTLIIVRCTERRPCSSLRSQCRGVCPDRKRISARRLARFMTATPSVQNCVMLSVFPSGSLKHATPAPLGEFQIPSSSCDVALHSDGGGKRLRYQMSSMAPKRWLAESFAHSSSRPDFERKHIPSVTLMREWRVRMHCDR